MILQGNLLKVSLSSLLQVVLSDRLAGEIRIHPEGVLRIRGGHVVGCEVAGLVREEALLECVFRGGETFVFEGEEVEGEPLANLNQILFEAYRLKDEWMKARRDVYRARRSLVKELPAQVEPLVAAMDGRTSLQDIFAGAAVPVTRVLDDLLALKAKGVLVRCGEAPEEPERSFYEWVDVARNRWKAKDLEGAEEAYTRALALRPTDRTVQHNLTRVRELRHVDTKQV